MIINSQDFIVPKDDSDLANYKPRSPYHKQLIDCLDKKEAVLLIGEAGTGKTSAVRYYAQQTGLPFLHFSCDNLLDFGEMLGYLSLEGGNTVFNAGAMLELGCNQPTIILGDEVTMIDSGKFGRLQVAIEHPRRIFVKEADNGRGKYYQFHKDTRIVLAGNPVNASYAGTQRVNVALLRRVKTIYFPTFTIAELTEIFVGSPELEQVLAIYKEIQDLINKQGIKITFSITDLRKIFSCLSLGYTLEESFDVGFFNGVKLACGLQVYTAFVGVMMSLKKSKKTK